MNNFECLTNDELVEIDGGAGLEIMIGTKVISGAAAFGVVGVGVVVTVGVLGVVAYAGYRVATS